MVIGLASLRLSAHELVVNINDSKSKTGSNLSAIQQSRPHFLRMGLVVGHVDHDHRAVVLM
jgi:hypothetical protein